MESKEVGSWWSRWWWWKKERKMVMPAARFQDEEGGANVRTVTVEDLSGGSREL